MELEALRKQRQKLSKKLQKYSLFERYLEDVVENSQVSLDVVQDGPHLGLTRGDEAGPGKSALDQRQGSRKGSLATKVGHREQGEERTRTEEGLRKWNKNHEKEESSALRAAGSPWCHHSRSHRWSGRAENCPEREPGGGEESCACSPGCRGTSACTPRAPAAPPGTRSRCVCPSAAPLGTAVPPPCAAASPGPGTVCGTAQGTWPCSGTSRDRGGGRIFQGEPWPC